MWCFDRVSTNGWEMISMNDALVILNKPLVILNEVKDLSFGVRKVSTKHDWTSSAIEQATRFFAALRMTRLSGLRITMQTVLRMTR